MSLQRLVEPQISLDDPWDADVFSRKQEGLILAKLVSTMQGSCVIAVKGAWGSGKSVFFRRMEAQLERDFVPVVMLDAWRDDFLADPLLAFMAAITRRLERCQRAKSKKIKDKASKIVSSLAEHGSKLLPPVAALLSGAFMPGAAQTAAQLATAAGKVGELLLGWEKEQKDAADKFRSDLVDARDLLTGRTTGPIIPIVVIVDELDRCRPTFSVSLLERMKHYFDVPGVVFLIGSDGANLPNAVRSVYGPSIDGSVYLRKFFDYEYSLSDPDPGAFALVLRAQFGLDALIGPAKYEAEIREAIREGDEAFVRVYSQNPRAVDAVELLVAFPSIAKEFELSPRDQAQAFTAVSAYLRSVDSRTTIFPAPLALAACLRFSFPEAFDALRKGAALEKVTHTNGQLTPVGLRIRRTSVGQDLVVFEGIEKHENAPEQYLVNFIQGAAQKGDLPMVACGQRASRRFQTAGGSVGVRSFISRSIRMADAFSQER